MGVDLRRPAAIFSPMKILNLICSAALLSPLFAAASHGAGEARVENFGTPVFGKAVKIDGVNPRAMALCADGKTLYIGSYH